MVLRASALHFGSSESMSALNEYQRLVDSGRRILNLESKFVEGTVVSRWSQRCYRWLLKHTKGTSFTGEFASLPETNPKYKYFPDHDGPLVTRRLKVLARAAKYVSQNLESQPSAMIRDTSSKKVFLVHGHDEALRETVARFVASLGLKPIIFHELPDKGRTIIEKFIDSSQVPFAIVMLTPDDTGRKASTPTSEEHPRARQNVIFEFGYFIGKLGRENVCALYTEGVELPSDYHGVLYIKAGNSTEWRLRLAREMKAAGFEINLNAI